MKPSLCDAFGRDIGVVPIGFGRSERDVASTDGSTGSVHGTVIQTEHTFWWADQRTVEKVTKIKVLLKDK